MSISLLDLKLWQFLFKTVLTGIPEIAKKPCLKFFQYLGTGTSKRHQIWHEYVNFVGYDKSLKIGCNQQNNT